MNYIGVNGKITPAAEAVVSVMDHGFMYGVGLFETFRTYGGQPFLLERHLRRLTQGCQSLGIQYEADYNAINQEIQHLLKANELQDAYIRFTVSAGEDHLGLPTDDYAKPTVVIYMKSLPTPNSQLYSQGKELWRLTTHRNTPEGDIRFKSLHYMNNILAKREMLNYKFTSTKEVEGLMMTEKAYLAEGVVSNLFFVSDGTLYTPHIRHGILPGITRAVVLEIAGELGIPYVEGDYVWDSLCEADEIFVTNSIQEIVPVTRLVIPNTLEQHQSNDHQIISGGTIGPITTILLDSYRKKVGL